MLQRTLNFWWILRFCLETTQVCACFRVNRQKQQCAGKLLLCGLVQSPDSCQTSISSAYSCSLNSHQLYSSWSHYWLSHIHMFSFTESWEFSRQPVCWKEINPSSEAGFWILSGLGIHVFMGSLFISGPTATSWLWLHAFLFDVLVKPLIKGFFRINAARILKLCLQLLKFRCHVYTI